jgi:hypothetical protein
MVQIEEIEARDPLVGRELRRLAEGFQYQALLNLFAMGAVLETGAV